MSTEMRRGSCSWKKDGCRKRLYDIGLSYEEKCRGFNKEEGTEKHRLYHCSCWKQIRYLISEGLEKWEQRGKTSKEDWKFTEELRRTLRKNHLTVREWESEKAQKLEHSSRRFPEPRSHGWLCIGSIRQVECVRVVSCAARLRQKS